MNNSEQKDRSLVLEKAGPGRFRITFLDEPAELYVSGHVGREGRPVITDAVLRIPAGIRAAHVRAIPFGRIEASIAAVPRWREWFEVTATDLVGPLQELVYADAVAQPTRAPLTPPDRRNAAEFYQRVAEAYRDHHTRTKDVAMAIAAAAGVSPAAARRWIFEARRRGYLEKGGRATG